LNNEIIFYPRRENIKVHVLADLDSKQNISCQPIKPLIQIPQYLSNTAILYQGFYRLATNILFAV
jgi:hypothetical protein